VSHTPVNCSNCDKLLAEVARLNAALDRVEALCDSEADRLAKHNDSRLGLIRKIRAALRGPDA
jgi:hypothetical protein